MKVTEIRITPIHLFFIFWGIFLIINILTADRGLFDEEKIRLTEEVPLNEFLTMYDDGAFDKITENNNTELEGLKPTGTTGTTTLMSLRQNIDYTIYDKYVAQKSLGDSLTDLGISYTGDTEVTIHMDTPPSFFGIPIGDLISYLFFAVLFFFAFKLLTSKGGGMGLPFNIKAGKLASSKTVKTRFADVIGMEEVKGELQEVVDYLKNPNKYHKVWARTPKGVLLYGQPGWGKTMLARAVAGEASVPFFSTSGSEFIEMFVWVWPMKMRELFTKAKAAGRAIIFIDEIDTIGAKRWASLSWAHREQENILNQILTEMDGFDENDNVIVIAATNRPDILDPALMRSGRFDRKIRVSRPTVEERELIFEYYLKKSKLAESVNINSLAKRTSWLVWADIENIVNEAALKIARDNRTVIQPQDFEYALEKVLMWPEKKIKSLSEKQRRIVAYHELGHAVTSYVLPNGDPVEKISIVSRGMALWVTWTVPEEDQYLVSKGKFKDDMVMLLWWRAAEEIYFGADEITTWASNDFERATQMAIDLHLKYGMDSDLGTVHYLDKEKDETYGHFRRYSDNTAEMADKKIRKTLETAYHDAKKIMTDHREIVDIMAHILLEKEYLTKEEFLHCMEDTQYAQELLEEAKRENEEHAKKIAAEKEEAEKKAKTTKQKTSSHTSKASKDTKTTSHSSSKTTKKMTTKDDDVEVVEV